MQLDALMGTVLSSQPADWESIPPPAGRQYIGTVESGDQQRLEVREHHSHYVLRSDVSITLAIGMDGFNGDRPLTFAWSAHFSDESVTGVFADVLFHGQVVHRKQLLVVDGARAYLPTPSRAAANTGQDDIAGVTSQAFTETVTEDEVSCARLCDRLAGRREFDRYLRDSELVQVPNPPRRDLPQW